MLPAIILLRERLAIHLTLRALIVDDGGGGLGLAPVATCCCRATPGCAARAGGYVLART